MGRKVVETSTIRRLMLLWVIAASPKRSQDGASAFSCLMCPERRFARDLQELVEDFGQRDVEVLIVGLLQVGEFDGLVTVQRM